MNTDSQIYYCDPTKSGFITLGGKKKNPSYFFPGLLLVCANIVHCANNDECLDRDLLLFKRFVVHCFHNEIRAKIDNLKTNHRSFP